MSNISNETKARIDLLAKWSAHVESRVAEIEFLISQYREGLINPDDFGPKVVNSGLEIERANTEWLGSEDGRRYTAAVDADELDLATEIGTRLSVSAFDEAYSLGAEVARISKGDVFQAFDRTFPVESDRTEERWGGFYDGWRSVRE